MQLPVVSMDVGDARKRLDKVFPSAVVNEFSAEKLAKAMLPILLERKRSNGAQWVGEVTLPHIASEIIAYYSCLLSSRSGKSRKAI